MISRLSAGGRPPLGPFFAAGSNGASRVHSTSVRSVAYFRRGIIPSTDHLGDLRSSFLTRSNRRETPGAREHRWRGQQTRHIRNSRVRQKDRRKTLQKREAAGA